MQIQGSSLGQADTGSVALPAVLRAGTSGPAQFSVGSVQPAKFSTTSHQAHTGDMPSTVSNFSRLLSPVEKKLDKDCSPLIPVSHSTLFSSAIFFGWQKAAVVL